MMVGGATTGKLAVAACRMLLSFFTVACRLGFTTDCRSRTVTLKKQFAAAAMTLLETRCLFIA